MVSGGGSASASGTAPGQIGACTWPGEGCQVAVGAALLASGSMSAMSAMVRLRTVAPWSVFRCQGFEPSRSAPSLVSRLARPVSA